MSNPDWMTCIHQAEGLCPSCQADMEEDEQSWIEFGHHEQGERNWQQLQDEIRLEYLSAERCSPPDPDLPF